jgi:hypothetical protein
MQAKRRMVRFVATAAIATGALTGSIAAVPNIFHDMSVQASVHTLTTAASATTPSDTTNIYHDM